MARVDAMALIVADLMLDRRLDKTDVCSIELSQHKEPPERSQPDVVVSARPCPALFADTSDCYQSLIVFIAFCLFAEKQFPCNIWPFNY